MALLKVNRSLLRTAAVRRTSSFQRWLTVLIAAMATAAASQRPSLEYQVKASYIYNLVQFVEWPSTDGVSQSSDFTICVIGANNFGAALDVLRGKQMNGHSIAVRYLRKPRDRSDCQVAFISASERWHQGDVIAAVSGPGVLTIGEAPGFIEDGGIINFIKVDDKIRFEISNESARRARLKISAQLLNLAS